MAHTIHEVDMTGPSGGKFTVLTVEESQHYQSLVERYMDHNSFDNVTDLQDLESVLRLEILANRYANFLSTEVDYYGEDIDKSQTTNMLKVVEQELRSKKSHLGLDKVTRSKDNSTSINEKWNDILDRARRFGYHRNKQAVTAVTMLMEIIAKLTIQDNLETEEEHKIEGVTDRDIITWLKETVRPQFEKIDRDFLENEQQYWTRD